MRLHGGGAERLGCSLSLDRPSTARAVPLPEDGEDQDTTG